METFRFLHGYPDSMYNCSGRTAEQWALRGEKWPLLGPTFLTIGLFYIVLYIPSVYAIIRLGLLRFSCYRIMIALICTDVLNLMTNSIISGYLAMIGAVFCTNPGWMFVQGAFSFTLWSAACFLYILLAVNRACALSEFKKLDWLFEKGYGLLWVLPLVAYSFYCGVYHTPLPFNSKVFVGIFLPLIDDDVAKELQLYNNPMLAINNITTTVLLTILYSGISMFICFQGGLKISKREKTIFLQCILITVPTQCAACLYVYMQYSSSSSVLLNIVGQVAWQTCTVVSLFDQYSSNSSVLLNIIGQVAWQTCTGIAALVYLTINQPIRAFLFSKKVVHAFSANGLSKKTDSPPQMYGIAITTVTTLEPEQVNAVVQSRT